MISLIAVPGQGHSPGPARAHQGRTALWLRPPLGVRRQLAASS